MVWFGAIHHLINRIVGIDEKITMNKRTKSNSIRIIAGQWRGRRLPVLEHEGLRPSTDRVRETLFNWLMHEVHGSRCLDLFAGSGALGLECLSRGAQSVLFVESDRHVSRQLQRNLETLNTLQRGQVLQQNALDVINKQATEPFDLVFLDPPFDSDLLTQVMPLLSQNAWLAENALVYVEQPSKQDPQTTPVGWSVYKEGKAGYSRYTLYSV